VGKIQKNGKSVIVIFENIEEVLTQKALVEVPEERPAGTMALNVPIGHLIDRAAWRLLSEKAPQYKNKFTAIKVEGEARIMVTFYNLEEE
jgi:hypothetical protein